MSVPRKERKCTMDISGSAVRIRGARVIDPAEHFDGIADIVIKDGRIAAVGRELEAAAARVVDARGLCAAPGLVDMHVHLRDPGQTHKEDIRTGCRAAAAGGVTTLAAMPNTVPAADNAETLAYMKAKAAGTGVHLCPIAAVTRGQRGEEPVDFAALAAAGAAAFSDDGHPVRTAAMMALAMREAAKAGRVVISHCEDPSLAGGLVNEGEVSRALGVKGVPAAAEEVQVAREAALAASYGLPVHIAHVSTAGSVAILRDFRRRGAPVTCETCPHYFSLDESAVLSRDADFRMNPPLRTLADVAAVAEGLRDGTIDAIVTDHAPHAPEEKADFEKAPNGVVGLETLLAAGITWLVRPGILTLPQLIEKMTAAPARILTLGAGTLRPDAPADIVLFDPAEQWVVEPEKLRSKARNTPYKGMTLTGRVKAAFSEGHVIFCDHSFNLYNMETINGR